MTRFLPYIGGAVLGAVVIGVQYAFAVAGEPRLHWIYCEVLRLCAP